MKRVHGFVVLVGLALASTPNFAQQPAPAATAESQATVIPPDQQATKEQLAKLFEVMRVREQINSLMKMMPTIAQKQVQAQMNDMKSKLPPGSQLTPGQQAVIDKINSKYMERILTIYSSDDMLDDMATVYQRHLSRTDIDAFIAFYDSPAGQHMLTEQPAIMKEYMPLVMQHYQARSKELTDEMLKEITGVVEISTPPASKPAPK